MRALILVGLVWCVGCVEAVSPGVEANTLVEADRPAADPPDPGLPHSDGDVDDDTTPTDDDATPVEDPTDDPVVDDTTPADPGCPPGITCVDRFPYVTSGTTTGAPSTMDFYACSPSTNESGPEVIYQVTLTEPGYLATELWGLPSGVDVDVHILGALDPDDCIDRGHWNAGALLPAGTYHVVVDSWTNSSGVSYDGAFTLGLNVTTADAFVADGLDAGVLDRALWAFDGAWFEGEADTFVYGVIDFSMPSTEPRFFVMDLLAGEMLFAVHTTHGEGSQDPTDLRYASTFSNTPESHQSSLGMVRAAETYYGQWGYSLRLDGLDPIFNDRVRPRAIVIHEATYATPQFAAQYGYLGRSWGCPAVDPAISRSLIDTLADGALVFKTHHNADFLNRGRFLDGY